MVISAVKAGITLPVTLLRIVWRIIVIIGEHVILHKKALQESPWTNSSDYP